MCQKDTRGHAYYKHIAATEIHQQEKETKGKVPNLYPIIPFKLFSHYSGNNRTRSIPLHETKHKAIPLGTFTSIPSHKHNSSIHPQFRKRVYTIISFLNNILKENTLNAITNHDNLLKKFPILSWHFASIYQGSK